MYGAKTLEIERDTQERTNVELADAHCHLDMVDANAIASSKAYGVSVMITNGGSMKANMETLRIADGKHVFAAIGMGPEEAVNAGEEEVEFSLGLVRKNKGRIVGVGEVGLDYKIADSFERVALQKTVLERFIDIAAELGIPISIHSRNAMDDLLKLLEEKKAEKVHLHFFEGDVAQAKTAASRGYFISVPPIESSKRNRAIKEIPIEQLMAESDSPAAGALPKDVEKSVMIIAKAKGIDYARAAEITTANTKRFFNIGRQNLMRMH
jgi:TatD DNase family protein